jgi:hypothetical protein
MSRSRVTAHKAPRKSTAKTGGKAVKKPLAAKANRGSNTNPYAGGKKKRRFKPGSMLSQLLITVLN